MDPATAPAPAEPLRVQPPAPTMSPRAASLVAEANAAKITAAIGQVERTTHISVEVLRDMGYGAPPRHVPIGALEGTERAIRVSEVAAAYVSADDSLKEMVRVGSTEENTAASVLAVGRKLNTLLGLVLRETESTRTAAAGASTAALPATVYVTAQTDEDRGYSNERFGLTERQGLELVLKAMYNVKLPEYFLPSMALFKKLSHWATVVRTSGDPRRIPLKKFMADGETIVLAMKRALYGTLLVAAGQEAMSSERDEGAGAVAGKATQWLSAPCVHALIAEIEEARERLRDDEARLEAICTAVWAGLHKSTAEGGTTMSLACRQQAAKVSEHVTLALMMGVLKRPRKGFQTEAERRRESQAGTPARSKRKQAQSETKSNKTPKRRERPTAWRAGMAPCSHCGGEHLHRECSQRGRQGSEPPAGE
jgi:hypothetical protein